MTEATTPPQKLQRLVTEVSKVVLGKEPVVEKIALAVATGSHVLLEDFPGVAKTLMVKTCAQALGLQFRRIQFTPDLMPADVTGSFFFNLQANRFEIRKGPVFTNILLADEINRAPPKTQSALLEAMQERQTTLEGEAHPLPDPFFVFATQNPIESEGTYPLPEAQLDRFAMRVRVGYPSRVAEIELLRRREAAGKDETQAAVVLDRDDLAVVQRATERVRLDDAVKDYIVRLVEATRVEPRVAVGASPRATLALYKLAKGHAVLRGRPYVVPDDVKALALPVLAHRIIVNGAARARGTRGEDVVLDVVNSTPTPVPATDTRVQPRSGSA